MVNHDDRIPPALAVDEEPFELDALEVALGDWQPDEIGKLLAAWDDDSPDDYEPERAAVMRFRIDNDGLAEWAMAHVAALDTQGEADKAAKQAYVDRITRHYAAAARRRAGQRAFFEAHLIEYARAFRDRDPKRNKTLHTPSGTVRSTEHQPAAEIVNEAEVAAWVLEHFDPEDAASVVKLGALVSELRKRVVINKVAAGYEVTLECGHVHLVPPSNPLNGDAIVPDQLRADGMGCDECEPDPIDGLPWRKVTRVDDWDEPTVQSVKGETIPGVRVSAKHVTFSVKPS
jgi:hypothetical protein